MSSRRALAGDLPSSSDELGRLMENVDNAKIALDAKTAALAEKRERRSKPRPEDTAGDLIKIANEILADEAYVAIATRDYEQAIAALGLWEEKDAKERHNKRRADIEARFEALKGRIEVEFCRPLRKMTDGILTELDTIERERLELNAILGPDEEPIVNTFEAMRQTPGVPDQVVEVPVQRRVRPRNWTLSQPGDQERWPLETVVEKQTIPGRPRINPTPLHEAFSAPALRPGEENYRVKGTSRGKHFIDVNGADY